MTLSLKIVKQVEWSLAGGHLVTPPWSEVLGPTDFTVQKKALYYGDDDQPKQASVYALIRESDQAFLGHVGHRYKAMQPAEVKKVFEDLISFVGGDCHELASGSLHNGTHLYFLAQLPKELDYVLGSRTSEKEDRVHGCFLLHYPLSGKEAINLQYVLYRPASQTTICLPIGLFSGPNNLNTNPGPLSEVQFSARDNLKQTHYAQDPDSLYRSFIYGLGQIYAAHEWFKKKAYLLEGVNYEEEELTAFFHNAFKTKKAVRQGRVENAGIRRTIAALRLLPVYPGSEHGYSNWWSALHSLCYVIDHELSRNNPENRVYQAWFGLYQYEKIRRLFQALDIITERLSR